MKIGMISFTRQGFALAKKIEEKLKSIHTVNVSWCSKENQGEEVLLKDWSREHFLEDDALIFVGAAGIAVRSIAPFVRDKLTDPAVLVIDEMGRFVIPILSGHVGGANALAEALAENFSAVPVLTTATDVNHRFAVDVFAEQNGLFIVNKAGIKTVSAKLLRGEEISFFSAGAVKGTLPYGVRELPNCSVEQVDFLISPFEEKRASLVLVPKVIVLGIGCKAGKSAAEINDFVELFLKNTKIRKEAIKAVCSIDKKKEESGILIFCKKENLPFFTYSAEELNALPGVFCASAFVEKTVGVDNVCERAARKGCGENGKLIIKKCAGNGITLAAAMTDWSVSFDA